MINIVVTSKPVDGLLHYSYEYCCQLNSNGVPARVVIIPRGKYQHKDYIKSLDKKYKYVWNPTDMDELYDMIADPNEMDNRIYDKTLSEDLSKLRKRLHKQLVEMNDPWGSSKWMEEQLLKGKKA